MTTTTPTAQADYTRQVHHQVHRAHKLQRQLRRPARPYHGHTRFRTLVLWRGVVRRMEGLWTPWPRYWLGEAICVHGGEGAWDAISNTTPRYYGGMQADRSFQATYGPEFYSYYHTADLWMPHQQLLMAYRGWLRRGWTPWPNTARACGLL